MTASEARALMPRNRPTLDLVLIRKIYPEIARCARSDVDGVKIFLWDEWTEEIIVRLRNEGYSVAGCPEEGSISIQWGGGLKE